MIRARVDLGGKATVLVGLSGENVARLLAGEQIMVNMEEMGVPGIQVVIMYGKTERHIAGELEQHGLLPPGTASDMPEPKPGERYEVK